MSNLIQDNYVCVPMDEELYGELLKRLPDAGVRGLIEDIAWDYLERTADKQNSNQREDSGVTWGKLYLPGGTKLMMEYKGQQHIAVVSNNSINYKDEKFVSPARLARYIASGTSRNAWRDIWIKRPTDKEWIQADQLRSKHITENSIDLKKLFQNIKN